MFQNNLFTDFELFIFEQFGEAVNVNRDAIIIEVRNKIHQNVLYKGVSVRKLRPLYTKYLQAIQYNMLPDSQVQSLKNLGKYDKLRERALRSQAIKINRYDNKNISDIDISKANNEPSINNKKEHKSSASNKGQNILSKFFERMTKKDNIKVDKNIYSDKQKNDNNKPNSPTVKFELSSGKQQQNNSKTLISNKNIPEEKIDKIVQNDKPEKLKSKIENENSNRKLKSKIENENDILKQLYSGIVLSEINDSTKVHIENLKNKGYEIVNLGNTVKIEKNIVTPIENVYNYQSNWTNTQVIKFGVVSDTHLCNKSQQLTFLNHLYDIWQSEGITQVFHVGDLTDGYNKRRSEHIYELFKLGADEQVDYVINNYPKRDKIQTSFILGNHDGWHINNGGINIGKQISKARSDMTYLGLLNAVVYLTPNCKMELNHPLDGASYAMSYSIQKYIDSISGGQKPNILLNGHHHKFNYMLYRNIHALECGTTEAQTAWMKGKRIAAHMGGLTITIHVAEDGSILKFIPEFIPLYKPLSNDY